MLPDALQDIDEVMRWGLISVSAHGEPLKYTTIYVAIRQHLRILPVKF
ncbi:MAG: hypothetical protein ACREU3_08015 [Steroidobacteraceae bacterium]